MTAAKPDFIPQGAQALLLSFPAEPSAELLQLIAVTRQLLLETVPEQLLETVPSYNSLLLVFKPRLTDHQQLTMLIGQLWPHISQRAGAQASGDGKLIELPCYYSAQTGPDLAVVAARHQLSVAQVIELHSRQSYQVYAIGFAPGFAYLGFTSEQLATPRLATPRRSVPAGSVAIADRQTAVYPAQSPAGWHVLGNCPLRLFDLNRQPVMPFAVGDSVRFVPIELAEFHRLGGQLPTPQDWGQS